MESTDTQIFKEIADQIVKVDFTNDRFEFFKKHSDTFEDTEENKLEYTPIHEAYIYILEKMIEENLSQKFNQDQIDAFYGTFIDNMAAYKDFNSHAVETLYGFIDFEKFKAEIIKYKKDMAQMHKEPETQVQGENSQFQGQGEDFFWEMYNESVTDPSKKWSKQLEMPMKDDFSMVSYTKDLGSDKQRMSRGEMVMKNVSMEAMRRYQTAMFSGKEDMPWAKDMKIVEQKDENDKVMYSRSKMPMMSERESLIHWKKRKLEDGRELTIFYSVERDDYPIDPKVIRIDMFQASLAKEVGNDLHTTTMSQFDMKGYFPMRLMNMVMGSMMSKRMNGFKDTCQKYQREVEAEQ